jgi:hypothetical protein
VYYFLIEIFKIHAEKQTKSIDLNINKDKKVNSPPPTPPLPAVGKTSKG